MGWRPSLGAWLTKEGVRFRVWAPEAKSVSVVIERGEAKAAEYLLEKSAEGFFEGTVREAEAGSLYRYRLDGGEAYPDPASRFQPQGVHGPSEVVDPRAFPWRDSGWRGVEREDLVLYELHVGTFTPGGTFEAAREKLPYLKELGVTAVEVMPVADFAGNRNWGYDGVALFAPARCYGAPEDLRRFVDAAHAIGLAVHLDVVYNHFGPDGAYAAAFSRYYFSTAHESPWGAGINFDGEHSREVRRFFIENALYWIHEYHIDGLRLDATHAIVDNSPRHFLAELTEAVEESLEGSGRRAMLIAEDVRNLAHMVKPREENGWGLEAVWSDDFHHQVRRCLAGDRDGYFQDFEGTAADIAETARRGWFYTGQYAQFFGEARGTDPEGLAPSRFLFFVQNHDQVGNRAFGERLHCQIELAAYRAATALLLLLPQVPLLFMGQEWAASSPFRFFTDHFPELGRKVTEGRRNEFSRFAAYADPKTRESIPDPQDAATFEASRLNWEEQQREPHAPMMRFYQALLRLRQTEPALGSHEREDFEIAALDDNGLLIRREGGEGPALLGVIRLAGSGGHDLRGHLLLRAGEEWEVALSSEDRAFACDASPVQVELSGPAIQFTRPGAVVLRARGRGRERKR